MMSAEISHSVATGHLSIGQDAGALCDGVSSQVPLWCQATNCISGKRGDGWLSR
jgi:hypothetical protein